jgi:hypothetical protein
MADEHVDAEREWTKDIGYQTVQGLLQSDGDSLPLSIYSFSYGRRVYDSAATPQLMKSLSESFEQNRTLWEESEVCTSLIAHLDSCQIPRISSIICFGLGAPSTEHSALAKHSHLQHALIVTLRQWLGKRDPGAHVTVLCQDPVYCDLDKELIKNLNMSVMSDPTAFLKIDEESLVYTVSPNICVRQITADMRRPAAMIWNTVMPTTELELKAQKESCARIWERRPELRKDGKWCVTLPYVKKGVSNCGVPHQRPELLAGEVITFPSQTDPSSRRVRAMIKEYKAWSFPQNDGFGDVTLYTRNTK